jgi:hypothetical protein
MFTKLTTVKCSALDAMRSIVALPSAPLTVGFTSSVVLPALLLLLLLLHHHLPPTAAASLLILLPTQPRVHRSAHRLQLLPLARPRQSQLLLLLLLRLLLRAPRLKQSAPFMLLHSWNYEPY